MIVDAGLVASPPRLSVRSRVEQIPISYTEPPRT